MSERTFFSLRNTLPGYTFLFWNLLLNLKTVVFFFFYFMPTIDPSSNAATLFGIILGFLTLLSGAAIGFLVSQFWHLIYWLILEKCLATLYKEELMEDFEVKSKKASVLVYNYIVHSFKEKRISSYIGRRWDLINVFGSTVMAIVLGSISGLTLRNYVLGIPPISNNLVNWQTVDLIIFLASLSLILASIVGFYYVAKSSFDMGIFVIRLKAKELAEQGKKLKDELPREYFKS